MIDRFDLRYSLAQVYVNACFNLNFQNVIYIGKENIPSDKPVVFAPNHRNALIDALTLVNISRRKQIVFLARADIFKKKFVAWLLRGLRIIPVYRIRDGKDNLSKNSDIFEICGKILQTGNPICLFPEAVHNPHQSLLPLQKAIPRIVLPTEAQNNFELDTHIVPVAIYYTRIHGFLSDVYITFGKPLQVIDYKELYQSEENLAINTLRHDLDKKLRSYVVDVPENEFYEQYIACLDWNAGKLAKKEFPKAKDGLIQASQKIIRDLNELFATNRSKFEERIQNFKQALEILQPYGLTSSDNIENPISAPMLLLRYLILIITAPVSFFGFFNTIFPILIYKELLKVIKDKQFISSIRVVSAVFIVPFFYILQTALVWALTHNFVWALWYLAITGVSFLDFGYWRKLWKSTLKAQRVYFFVKRHKKVQRSIIEMIRFGR